MQWGAHLFKNFSGNWGAALQLLSGTVGLIGIAYGLQVLMVERAEVPLCSAEVLAAVGEQSFLKEQQLTVEVAGAVVNPGVWQLPVGSRVALAIEKAGGFSQRADRDFTVKGLNLADPVKDGQKIYVPFAGEKPEQQATAGNASEQSSVDSVADKISVNTATAESLETLPGIGETRATKIIENRPYHTLDELVVRKVLTEGIFDEIKELISL
ncbi:MAG: hypothetical protein UX28_C0003G0168 [Candidatus Pacebacteria bacterium GW2011_GWA1_46_10]|nr:MAG: hypothetical protein UX28_C0003G0168 [Candidatus Pacebacteria bacterium GW2011_GWA1_46_10]HCR81614.1 hypothetical protein [Candidatus Paceibacterota bacterium]